MSLQHRGMPTTVGCVGLGQDNYDTLWVELSWVQHQVGRLDSIVKSWPTSICVHLWDKRCR